MAAGGKIERMGEPSGRRLLSIVFREMDAARTTTLPSDMPCSLDPNPDLPMIQAVKPSDSQQLSQIVQPSCKNWWHIVRLVLQRGLCR